jgi:hypothetical protein
MKQYLKPILIGLIAGILPNLFEYSIITWQWWGLMLLFSFMIWFIIHVINYIWKL